MKINKVIALTKIFLKSSFQSTNATQATNMKAKSGIGRKLLYLFLFIYIGAIMGYVSYGMITSLATIHQEAIFLGLFFLMIAFFMIFQSIFSTINVFYFSKDIEYVLPWPLSPKEILAAKFNVILVTEYVMELLIGFVPLILYGILTGAGLMYYVFAFILLVVFPILPLLLSAFIVMIVMSFAKLTKKRDSFQLIATLLIIVIVFGIQFFTSGNSQKELTQEQMVEQLTKANGVVSILGNYFITLNPSINALIETNLAIATIELIKVILITALAYILFLALGQKLYLRGAIGNLVGGKTKKKKINIDRVYQEQPIGKSYVKKELKILIRNPIFFMQCVLPAILMPILFFGIMVFSLQESNKAELIQLLPNVNGSLTIFILLGIMQFLSMMLYIAITAISRDGLNAIFVKYIPVSLYQQFQYKIIPNIIMHAIATLIVVGMFYYVFPETSLLLLLAIFILQIVIAIITSDIGLIIDLKRPKLEWTTEYAVVKQNMNLGFPMVFGLAGIILFVILGIVFAQVSPIFTLAILFIVFSSIAVAINHYIQKHQVQLFEKIR